MGFLSFFADGEKDRHLGSEAEILCALPDIELEGGFALAGLSGCQTEQTILHPLAGQLWCERLPHQNRLQPAAGFVLTGADKLRTIKPQSVRNTAFIVDFQKNQR